MNEIEKLEAILKYLSQKHIFISTTTLRAFFLIGLNPGISITKLAEKLGCHVSVAARVSQILEKKEWEHDKFRKLGWIYKVYGTENKRQKFCYLTDKGETIFENCQKIMEE